MKCTFQIRRSDEWLAAERLRTGENVPAMREVEVEVSELGEDARQTLLLIGRGEYPSVVWCITFDRSYEPTSVSRGGFGSEDLQFDGDSPTPADVATCLVHALAKITERAKECERQRAENEAAREAQRKAGEEHQAAKEAARELLASELAHLDAALADRDTLANFLAEIPLDALQGTVHRVAGDLHREAQALRDKIEAASPRRYIFGRASEEDDED